MGETELSKIFPWCRDCKWTLQRGYRVVLEEISQTRECGDCFRNTCEIKSTGSRGDPIFATCCKGRHKFWKPRFYDLETNVILHRLWCLLQARVCYRMGLELLENTQPDFFPCGVFRVNIRSNYLNSHSTFRFIAIRTLLQRHIFTTYTHQSLAYPSRPVISLDF